MTLQQHLDWLLYLMADHPEAWKHHCWHRAKELASLDPELADLPGALTAALSSTATSSSGGTAGK